MAGRDLFANKSPQYLASIGSNHPKVKEWTLMEKLQGSQNTPEGVFKDAAGNEYDVATGQMLKPVDYAEKQPEKPKVAVAPSINEGQFKDALGNLYDASTGELIEAVPNRRAEREQAAKQESMLAEQKLYAPRFSEIGSDLKNAATDAGAVAMNTLLEPHKTSLASDEDKRRQK